MKKILSVLIIAMLMISLCACGGENPGTVENDNNNVEKTSSTLSMEKMTVGNFTFMVPDNGDIKFSNGGTTQNFYFENGDTGVVWYSIDGPLGIPTDEDGAHDLTSSLGEIVEFKYDETGNYKQAIILNKYQDEYQGVRLVTNINDEKDCIWLSVIGTDKNVIKTILDSLKW